MGIKDETPDDKVIFDSLDNRMKYSKGIQVDPVDPCACHDCVYKENNPYKEPCGTCLSPLNDKSFYVKEGSAVIPAPKTDNPKNMDDIYDKVRQIYERQLLMYDMIKDIYDSIETEDKCQTCKHKDELPYGICTSCIFNTSGTYYYEEAEDIK